MNKTKIEQISKELKQLLEDSGGSILNTVNLEIHTHNIKYSFRCYYANGLNIKVSVLKLETVVNN